MQVPFNEQVCNASKYVVIWNNYRSILIVLLLKMKLWLLMFFKQIKHFQTYDTILINILLQVMRSNFSFYDVFYVIFVLNIPILNLCIRIYLMKSIACDLLFRWMAGLKFKKILTRDLTASGSQWSSFSWVTLFSPTYLLAS